MAHLTTYLLVTNVDDPEQLKTHSVLDECGFEQRATEEGEDETALQFALERPLDEADDVEGPLLQLSAEHKHATFVMCDVEERFDQVERLQVTVLEDGEAKGDIDHGYIFNVGTG